MESDVPPPPPLAGDAPQHEPVLYQEVLATLAPRAGGRYLDGTLGLGGHAWGLLTASSPDGTLLALDQDPTAIGFARRRLAPFGDRVTIVRANFVEMAAVAAGRGPFDGILLDVGLSSLQLADEARGFSFHADSPLDMRMDPDGPQRAADLVNTLDERSLADLIYRYGDERRSRRIARAIVSRRPFSSARELGETIAAAVGRGRKDRIHPATRTFQALRIAVNDELGVLERVLPDALSLLRPGGRLAVISFHSLEDRIVKNHFRNEATDCLCPPKLLTCVCGHQATVVLVTRKPIRPGEDEIRRNPRARSARLRVAERLAGGDQSEP